MHPIGRWDFSIEVRLGHAEACCNRSLAEVGERLYIFAYAIEPTRKPEAANGDAHSLLQSCREVDAESDSLSPWLGYARSHEKSPASVTEFSFY